ncbi:MAG TPA: C40 family peptidase [Vicinamibacteria bacterium]|nr:C40 family peptidase [Vicinamibacteria bacterium]
MTREGGTMTRRRSLALALALAAAPVLAQPAAPPRQGVVTRPVENMYSGPDDTRDVVSQALLGQVVEVMEEKGGYLDVQTPDRYRGWIPAAAVRVYADAAEPRYASRGTVFEVTNLMANVYRNPDVTTARPRAQAPLGTRLEVVEGPRPDSSWITVRLPAGETGHVQGGDGRVVDAAAPRKRGGEADLVATARRFTGVPYLWGGMSPLGVDCSGLVSQVYAVNGVILPRDAHLQFDDPSAVPVERAQLRPGDLVFFGRTKITHVGMYVGEGRFINATTHETPIVQEDSLDDPHWAALYKGARRPGQRPGGVSAP